MEARVAKAKNAAKTTNAARSASSPRVKASASFERSTALARVVIEVPPAPEPSWEGLVTAGKRLVAERNQMTATADKMIAKTDQYDWQLAVLADQVVKVYGESTLSKFASEIGLAHCTIKRRRTVYRAWKEPLIGDPGLLSSLSYSVARALVTHPERARLVKENPGMSKRDATALMKAFRAKPESEMERWWKDVDLRMGKAAKDETRLDEDPQNLLAVVKQPMLSSLREAGQAWIRLADGLDKLFAEPVANEASFDTVDA
jgi:hypothetical protein